MELEEWELLPEPGFIDVHEDGPRRNPVFPRRETFSLQPSSLIDMNYLHKFLEQPQRRSSRVTALPEEVIKVPIQISPPQPTEFNKVPPKVGSLDDSEHGAIPHVPSSQLEENQFADMKLDVVSVVEKVLGLDHKDEERISRVCFKKVKENELDDMKFEHPEFKNKGFDEKGGDFDGVSLIDGEGKEEEEVAASDGSRGWLNMLRKWGIGGICSFGFAAATVCIIVLSSGQKEKHQQQNPKLRFRIYTDDKRIKQVMHHSSKLKEAISVVQGTTTFARAHITVGGYLERPLMN